MTDHSKKRRLQFGVYLSVGLVFMATASLLFLCLWGIKLIVTNTIANETEVVEIMNKGFPYVAGLVDLIITTLITAWTQAQIDIRLNAPQLMICDEDTKNYKISGIKKERPINNFPRITVGEEQARYRIVYAQIKNVGKGIMSECFVNKQKIPVNLEPGASSKLYIVLYWSNEGDNSSKNYEYHLPYKIQDANGNVYVGEYTMQVDLLTCQTQFRVKEKMKKGHC